MISHGTSDKVEIGVFDILMDKYYYKERTVSEWQ